MVDWPRRRQSPSVIVRGTRCSLDSVRRLLDKNVKSECAGRLDLDPLLATTEPRGYMAPNLNEVQQLEADFLSGRNPLSYIPLCQALRRHRQYSRALEICQRGLAGDPDSVAGRTLLARLFADVGRYQDCLAEVERAETRAPDAMGLLIEKARAQIHLHLAREAEETLHRLDARNPMDPTVQQLHAQFQAMRRATQNLSPAASGQTPLPRFDWRPEEVLGAVRRHIGELGTLQTLALLSLTSGQSLIQGDSRAAEAAERIYHETDLAFGEMDQGMFQLGVVELTKALVMIFRWRGKLLVVSVDPTANFGKLYVRINTVLNQLLPSQRPPRALRQDERTDHL